MSEPETTTVLHWTAGEPEIQQVDPRALTRPTRSLSISDLAALRDLCRASCGEVAAFRLEAP